MIEDDLVQVIVVGCGAVSQILYAPALQVLERSGEVKVLGLVDPAERQRAELQKSFPNASAYANLASCPLNADSLVVIASPPNLHAEQSVFALRQGAAVLCEKPMATSSAEAELMLEASRESERVLAVGLYRRFFPAFEALNDIFEQKPFGNLQNFSIQEGGKFAWGVASDSLFRRESAIGGVFFDAGIHVVDLLLWWFGEPTAFTYRDDAMGGIEANCQLEIAYPGGVHGTVRLSRDWDTRNRYLFSFERGEVIFKVGQANRLRVSVEGVPFIFNGELMRVSSGQNGGAVEIPTRTNSQSFTEQLRNVVAAIKGQQLLRVPGEEGIRSLRFIENCYNRRTLMEMPWLIDEERRAAEILAGKGN
jgi:predicted dehydrogenase